MLVSTSPLRRLLHRLLLVGSLATATVAAGLTTAAPAEAGGSLDRLVERLKNGRDFRVRVTAALQLGRSGNSNARKPLEGALTDPSVAVRSSAAAALKKLGDPAAIPALQRAANDKSYTVRRQAQRAIDSLRSKVATEEAELVVVKMGSFTGKRELVSKLEKVSRKKFAELPGVKVVHTSARTKKKAVLVSGRLKRSKVSRKDGKVIYRAKVEFVVQRLPDRTIASMIRGSARGESISDRGLSTLKDQVLEAAIASALRRAKAALRAAAD